MTPEAWKLHREAQLVAEVRTLEILLENARQELADLRELHDEKLAAVFGWHRPEELAAVEQSRQKWDAVVSLIWELGEHNLKAKGQAA
jgi:hypothetical protein